MPVTHNEAGSATPEQRFGTEVKEARETRGWSQEALVRHLKEAAGLDLHQTGLARLENGKRPIRLDEAVALCEVLGLSLGSYAGPPRFLTKEDFDKAVHEVELIRVAERELREKLARQRTSLDDEILKTEASIRSWREQRLQLEAAIDAYSATAPAAPTES